jgi:hypothetical protein
MKEEKQKISALMILEIIGKPEKYLVETLENIIKQMGNEPGVIIKNKNIKEPRKMEERAEIANQTKEGIKIQQNDFFVSFAEIEVEVENLSDLILLLFKYMPAHMEILSPSNFAITNYDLKDILNELMRRLHGYDEVARVLQVEKAILESKLRSLMEKNPDGSYNLREEEKGEKREIKKPKKKK